MRMQPVLGLLPHRTLSPVGDLCGHLIAAIEEHPTVLINHFPLREELVRLWRIPRFSIWCGTRRTHVWHTRFRARVVVSGHLHIPRTDGIDGVRFEEVSFGYPRQRPAGLTLDSCRREILPGPADAALCR